MKTNICTTQDQSARLLKCGVSTDTADMMFTPHNTLSTEPYKETLEDRGYIPAWSLSRLLYGIKISDAMSEAEHDCSKFQEAVYRATPAGLLWLTMREAGVEADGGVAKQICDRFFERLMDAGVLEKGDGDV